MAYSTSEHLIRKFHLRSFGRFAVVAVTVALLVTLSIVLTDTAGTEEVTGAGDAIPITDLPADLQDVVNFDDTDNPGVLNEDAIVVETEGGVSTLETLNEGEN